nr:MAG TPA: hypothetical protein [Caudoviricetes sp.]
MQELRLKYNDKEELQYLIKAVEAYIDNREKLNNQTHGFKSLRIIVVEKLRVGQLLNIAARTTKTGIIIAEIRK